MSSLKNLSIHNLVLGPLATNCWIPSWENSEGPGRIGAVIDPAASSQTIITQLEALKIQPRYVLLTHGHSDHYGALQALMAHYPQAFLAMHRGDAPNLPFLRDLRPHYVEEGDQLGPFRVLYLPGHSKGSLGFLLEEEKLLFSGDVLFHGDCGRTDLPGGNSAEMGATLRRLFAMEGDIRVFPGHEETTTIGEEAETQG